MHGRKGYQGGCRLEVEQSAGRSRRGKQLSFADLQAGQLHLMPKATRAVSFSPGFSTWLFHTTIARYQVPTPPKMKFARANPIGALGREEDGSH